MVMVNEVTRTIESSKFLCQIYAATPVTLSEMAPKLNPAINSLKTCFKMLLV